MEIINKIVISELVQTFRGSLLHTLPVSKASAVLGLFVPAWLLPSCVTLDIDLTSLNLSFFICKVV